jgi:hypothetical protein
VLLVGGWLGSGGRRRSFAAGEGTARHAEPLRDLIGRLHGLQHLGQRLGGFVLVGAELLVLLARLVELLLEVAMAAARIQRLRLGLGQLLPELAQLPAQPLGFLLRMIGLRGELLVVVEERGQQREELLRVLDQRSNRSRTCACSMSPLAARNGDSDSI